MDKQTIADALGVSVGALDLALQTAVKIEGGARCDALAARAQDGMGRVSARIDAYRAAVSEGNLTGEPPTWDELVKLFAGG